MSIKAFYKGLMVLFFGLLALALKGQKQGGIDYQIVGVDLYCYVDRDLSQTTIDSLLGTCDIKPEALALYHEKQISSASHWQVVEVNEQQIILRKPLKGLEGKPKEQKTLMEVLGLGPKSFVDDYRFGYNVFSKPAVWELDNGKTRFFLKVEGAKPESIYLSGTFNQWSTSACPMTACDSGYYADINLGEGAHYYKYIVNGHWLMDPRNRLKANDWEGNENSVYFKENYSFFLPGYKKAQKVHLAGSFSNWEPDNQGFIKVKGGWERPCYLEEGTHAYKFIVDGEWITDPTNPVVRKDEEGNENSFMAIGDTFYFYLPGYKNAAAPVVAGSFNDWNPIELKMTKTDSGWILPYVLAPGNYEYKFVLEYGHKWIIDPNNPHTNGEGNTKNSVLSLKPNKHFFYPHKKGLERVCLSGDFNAWPENGYTLEKQADGWHIDVHLPQGKTRYKFILNEDWVRDPNNPLFEPNEYDDYNSVIWMK